MKKIIFAFILIFSLSFFCGCNGGAKDLPNDYVAVGIKYLPDGQIVQNIELKTGLIDCFEGQEKSSFIRNVCKGLEEKRNLFLLSFAVKYLQNQKEEFSIGKGVVLTPVNYQKDSNVFGFEICFSSLSAWQFYNGISPSETQETGNIPFFEKRLQKSDFPLTNKGDEEGLGGTLSNIVINALEGLEKDKELKQKYTPSFVYCYSTYFSKIKSNADISTQQGGLYHHIWIEDNLDYCNQIEIYYYVYDRDLWLILGLSVPCLGLVIYLLVEKIKQKRKTD